MKTPVLLLALCLVLSFTARAQEQKKVSYQFRFSPLALLDLNTPVIQLGPQVSFRRFAFSGEFGFTFPWLQERTSYRSDSMFVDQHHHKIRLETKYYLGPEQENWFFEANPYISMEGFWVPRAFRRYHDKIEREGTTYSFEYSDVTRKVLGGCLKFGIEPVVFRHWVLDIFGGVGVRRLTISHQPVGLKEEDFLPYQWTPVFTRADQREGTLYRPHLALGFKVGFLLN